MRLQTMALHTIRRAVACGLLASLLVALVAPAQAQQTEAKPVAIIAVEKYDGLLGDITILGELGGQPKSGEQIENLLQAFTQGQGLVGIDKSRPWGVIVQTDGFQFAPIVCLPISDLDATLELVRGMGLDVTDDGKGMIEIAMPNQSIHIKRGETWAFASQQAELLQFAPADPGKLFAELTGKYDIGVKVLAPNIPDMYKQMALAQLQQGIEQGLQQNEGESDPDFESRKQAQLAQIEQISKLFNESEQLTAGLTVDESKGNAVLDVIYTALPGSELAEVNNSVEPAKSKLSGFVTKDPAASVQLAQQTPASELTKQRPQIEQAMTQLRSQISREIENSDEFPNDEARDVMQQVASDLIDAVEATVLTGTIDFGGSAVATPDKVTIVGGGYITEPKKVEAALKKFAALAADEPNAPVFEWDTETVDGVTFHRVTAETKADEEELVRMFGPTIEATIGIGKEHVYFAAGRDSADALKTAIAASKSAGAASVKPAEIVVSVESFIKLAAEFGEGPEQEVVKLISKELDQVSDGSTNIRLTTERIENGSETQIEIEAGVLQSIRNAMATMRAGGAVE